jgi:hypothetical protein
MVNYIIQKSFDVFLMMEVRLCWRKLENENQWHECILGKFRSSRSMLAYDATKLQTSKTLQPGGVGIVATDKVAHRVNGIWQGSNPFGTLDLDEISRQKWHLNKCYKCVSTLQLTRSSNSGSTTIPILADLRS